MPCSNHETAEINLSSRELSIELFKCPLAVMNMMKPGRLILVSKKLQKVALLSFGNKPSPLLLPLYQTLGIKTCDKGSEEINVKKNLKLPSLLIL